MRPEVTISPADATAGESPRAQLKALAALQGNGLLGAIVLGAVFKLGRVARRTPGRVGDLLVAGCASMGPTPDYDALQLLPEHAGLLCMVADGSHYVAELITMPDFGCVMHEAAYASYTTQPVA